MHATTHTKELERKGVLYVAQNEAREEGYDGNEWNSMRKKIKNEKKKMDFIKKQGRYSEVVK